MVKRIAMFIDGDNLFGTVAELGWLIDFVKFKTYFTKDKNVYNCFYYMSWDSNEEKKKNFSIFLLNNGYTVRKREQQKIMKAGKIMAIKGNTDIMMALDMIVTRRNWDTAIMVTGDGDFLPIVEFLRQQGKEIIAVSSKFESASIDLVNGVDKFTDLSTIKDQVMRVQFDDSKETEK